MKGAITISRVQGGGKSWIQIEVVDKMSGVHFVAVEMSLENFGAACTGLGFVDCDFEYRPELVGKRKETKVVKIPNKDFNRNDKQAVDKLFSVFEVDGWVARREDYFNHHNYNHDGTTSVVFFRYV